MTETFKLFMALSILAAIPLSSGAAENKPSYVPGTIEFLSGRSEEFNFVNHRLSFETCVGEIDLWLHELRSITVSNTGKKCTVNTVHKDTWSAKLEDDEFEYCYLDSRETLDLFETSVENISFSPVDQAPWTPKGHGRIFFDDANTVFIDVTDLTLEVRNDLGTWELPVGSVELMQFRLSRESDVVHVLARFPSGRTEQFRCAGLRRWFRATDTFGNRMKVRYEDAKVIRGREGVREEHERKTGDGKAEKEFASLRASAERQVVEVISKEGRTQTTRIPASVWTLRGSLGSVLLPAAMLREINREPRILGQCAVTAYGEYFFGAITPKTLSVPIPGREDKDARLNVLNQRRIGFAAPELPVPEGIRLFRMRDGDAFYGRFVEEDLSFATADTEKHTTNVPARSIVSVYRSELRDVVHVITDNDAMMSLRPTSKRVELALLVNGMKYPVRWDDLRSANLGAKKISKPIEPFTASEEEGRGFFPRLGNLFGARQEEPEKPVSSGDGATAAQRPIPGRERAAATVAPRHPGKIGVKTSLGTIELRYSLMHEIFSAPEASASCFVTVYGDSFVGKRFSGSQLAALSGRKYPGNRSRRIPRVVALNNKRRDPPSGRLAWRLTSGDLFYARFAEKSIKISVAEGANKTVEIDAKDILAVTRVPDKGFEFNSRGETVIGRPESGEVLLRLLCTGESRAAPFKLIECARSGTLAELPPPVTVVPGITPLQEGVVLMEGGSFMMGRKAERNGMPDETPRHEVWIPAFYIDACEVTRNQFERFADETGYVTEAEKAGVRRTWQNPAFKQEGDEPVVYVSWHDAVQYCNWRSKKAELDPCYEIGGDDHRVACHRERNGYRLPTEAEWEFAARNGGEDIEFPWMAAAEGGAASGSGETAPTPVLKANFAQAETERRDNWLWTNPVKTFAPNEAGLYGMGGNVWEWCQDLYFESAYYAVHRRHPRDPCVEAESISGLTRRVMRGGSFENELDMLRCASRGNGAPHAGANRVGFRCVRRYRSNNK